MPGIAGIIGKKKRPGDSEDIDTMINAMMREPYYRSGKYINHEMGIAIGWVCHELSFSDCMPVINEEKNIVLVFAGEDYASGNEFGLYSKGHEYDASNATYLVHLYEEQGDLFFEKINGWFSGLLIDLRKRKAYLFNDRYGMERIYYYEGKDEFLFASEAKCLLKIRPELRAINMKSLAESFVWDCVLENRSLFSNIHVLPGGSSWIFDNSKEVRKNQYFTPKVWEAQQILEKEVFYRKLRETFLTVLPRYFRAQQPIGMSLTSGLDTRTIMSNLEIGPGQLPCYTFSGAHRLTLDAKIAQKIAELCSQNHQVIRLGDEFLSNYPELAERTVYITDGCLDICGTHDIFFNSIARGIAPIRMTGKFGSEILWKASMLKNPIRLRSQLFDSGFCKYIQEAIDTLNDAKKGNRLTFAVFKETPWYQYGRLAMEMAKLRIRTPYMDNDLIKTMYQAPPDLRSSMEIRLRLIRDGNPELIKIMTDRGTAGEKNPAVSRIARFYYYFLFKTEYIYLYQLPRVMPKLDKPLSLVHGDKLILGRYQYVHPRIWFKKEIAEFIRETLLDKRTESRPYLRKEMLRKITEDHIKGEYNYVYEINKVLTSELIQRLLIEN